MEFICKRCNIIFSCKAYLKAHLQRKKLCVCINPEYDIDIQILLEELNTRKLNDKTYNCEYCEMKFNHASGKCQHKKICKKRTLNDKSEIKELKQTVNLLVSKVKELESLPKISNTKNITNNNTQNIINVNLKDFGLENMQAIPLEFIGNRFMNLEFRTLLENLHCDPDYPENHNVRIKSSKREIMEIYRNNKWNITTLSNGLEELLLQGYRIFKDYYRKNKDKILEEDLDENELRKILITLEKIQELDKNEIKPLQKDLQLMLEEFRNDKNTLITQN